MAIEAVSSAMAGAHSAPEIEPRLGGASIETVQPEALPESEAAESFRRTLGAIHDEVSRMKPASEMTNVGKGDAVDTVRNEIFPSPYKIASLSPGAGGMGVGGFSASIAGSQSSGAPVTSPIKGMDGKGNPTGDMQEGVRAMQAGFEHSLMVGLITQVMGGLTNTTTTLIKQA